MRDAAIITLAGAITACLYVALGVALFMPRALSAGSAEDIYQAWMRSGAPCTTQADIAELGGGDPAECMRQAKALRHLRPILGHPLNPQPSTPY